MPCAVTAPWPAKRLRTTSLTGHRPRLAVADAGCAPAEACACAAGRWRRADGDEVAVARALAAGELVPGLALAAPGLALALGVPLAPADGAAAPGAFPPPGFPARVPPRNAPAVAPPSAPEKAQAITARTARPITSAMNRRRQYVAA
jgi:hypothetical protein